MVYALEDQKQLRSLFFNSKRIRLVEEYIAYRYADQQMRCPTHLSVGQELAGAAIGLVTTSSDYAISTHRSHAHYLGKGGSLETMVAELYGKAEGCSKGRGGSMHLIDRKVGFEASTAIVGNSIPVGVGLAKAIKLSENKNICVIFIGDAAFETGVLYESMNIAATWELPVLFLCENNLYSVYSPLQVRQPENRKNYKLAKAIGLNSGLVDGMDAFASLKSIQNAVKYVRDNSKPFLLEMSAYRWREHCGPNFDNDIGYRTEAEFLDWKSKDYLKNLELGLLECSAIDNKLIDDHSKKVELELHNAFKYAISLPNPEATDFVEFEYGV